MSAPAAADHDALPYRLREAVEVERRTTDEHGYTSGWVGVAQVTDDEVPDNAHWKGWVW